MKHLVAIVLFVFVAVFATPSFAANSGEQKATKSATHKHHGKKDGCCCMKNMSEEKRGDGCTMDSKKESEKEAKEESKKETEKK